MMDKKKIFNLALLIIPWLTVPFMKKQSFIRFLPVASLISIILSVFSTIANRKRWWVTKSPLFSGLPIDFAYILGPYFVGTLWVFKLTYGNLPKYLFTNIVLDFMSAYPLLYLSEKLGIVKFKKMKNITWFFITTLMAILLYRFQYILEKSIKQTNSVQKS